MDSEVAQASSKNLIVVGGSCINSVAARLVGSAACGTAFTTATNGIGAGQFLIKSYSNPYSEGKVALLVAGYDAADTANAVTYLKTHDIDTTVAEQGYVGSSSTAAELKVTSA
jgi:S-layer protein (TIGR01564 family)